MPSITLDGTTPHNFLFGSPRISKSETYRVGVSFDLQGHTLTGRPTMPSPEELADAMRKMADYIEAVDKNTSV